MLIEGSWLAFWASELFHGPLEIFLEPFKLVDSNNIDNVEAERPGHMRNAVVAKALPAPSTGAIAATGSGSWAETATCMRGAAAIHATPHGTLLLPRRHGMRRRNRPPRCSQRLQSPIRTWQRPSLATPLPAPRGRGATGCVSHAPGCARAAHQADSGSEDRGPSIGEARVTSVTSVTL